MKQTQDKRKKNRCSLCKGVGHTKRTCDKKAQDFLLDKNTPHKSTHVTVRTYGESKKSPYVINLKDEERERAWKEVESYTGKKAKKPTTTPSALPSQTSESIDDVAGKASGKGGPDESDSSVKYTEKPSNLEDCAEKSGAVSNQIWEDQFQLEKKGYLSEGWVNCDPEYVERSMVLSYLVQLSSYNLSDIKFGNKEQKKVKKVLKQLKKLEGRFDDPEDLDIAQSNIADNYLDGAKKRNQDHFGYFVIREILEENKINITSESGEKNE